MPITIDIREFPARREEALAQVSAGGEVVFSEGTIARARLMPLTAAPQRIAGLHPGAIQPASDFDAPLPDDFWTGQP